VGDDRPAGAGQGPQLEGHLHDHPEGAERARDQPAEVVAADVLDRAAARADPAAVAGDQLDLQDQVADGSHRQAPRRGRGRRDHAADRRALGRVDRPLLALLGQHLVEPAAAHAGLDHREHLLGVVVHQAVEAGQLQLRVHRARVALVQVGAPADRQQPAPAGPCGGNGRGDLVAGAGSDQIHDPSRTAAA